MQISKNIKKTIYVFKSEVNGYTTAKALSTWREDGLREIDLQFRDGSKFTSLPLGAAWTLISYYYWSHRLKSYDAQDLKDLNKVALYIYKRIKETYDTWPKGGWGMQGTHGILYALIRHYKPKHLLETGIAHGYSATVMLSAMGKNGVGTLTSVDNSDIIRFFGKEDRIGWLVPEELRSNWEIKIGLTKDVLPNLNEEFDAFYHDSDHSEKNMLFEFEWADKRLKSNSLLISDDIDLNRAWSIFLKSHRNYTQIIKSATTGASLKR
ncbi:MAG: class I SAM-dependent methyltransferase [Candidatus Thermoplasmatota archaeon]|nr:class I SAM-dependent methyltransferase [Candidatus Thermoplasmatota archaeon]